MSQKSRQIYNRLILEHIEDIIDKNPDIRFGQLLNNLGVVSDTRLFYEEPNKTLEKVNRNIDGLYNSES